MLEQLNKICGYLQGTSEESFFQEEILQTLEDSLQDLNNKDDTLRILRDTYLKLEANKQKLEKNGIILEEIQQKLNYIYTILVKEKLGDDPKIYDKNSAIGKFLSDPNNAVKVLKTLANAATVAKSQNKAEPSLHLLQHCDLETLDNMRKLGEKLQESPSTLAKMWEYIYAAAEFIVVVAIGLMGALAQDDEDELENPLADAVENFPETYYAKKQEGQEEVIADARREFIDVTEEIKELSNEAEINHQLHIEDLEPYLGKALEQIEEANNSSSNRPSF